MLIQRELGILLYQFAQAQLVAALRPDDLYLMPVACAEYLL
jgi:hypothetical protein